MSIPLTLTLEPFIPLMLEKEQSLDPRFYFFLFNPLVDFRKVFMPEMQPAKLKKNVTFNPQRISGQLLQRKYIDLFLLKTQMTK